MPAHKEQSLYISKIKQKQGLLRLFISKRLIQGAAAALTATFGPIFLYLIFDLHFWALGLYYAVLSLLYVVIIVPGMHATNYIGFSRALMVGGIFSIAAHLCLFAMNQENAWLFLPLFAIAIAGFRVFHWVPYHVDFTIFTRKSIRGQVLSISFATIAFFGVIGPILAGFIIQETSYNTLFGISTILLLLATISYMYIPSTYIRYEWSFSETWSNLFHHKYRGVVLGEFAGGAENIVTTVVWPIFLFTILSGDVFEIGAVSTLVVGVTIGLQLLIGRFIDIDRNHKVTTLKWGSGLYALGWVFKIFVLSTAQIFFVGLYHNVVKIFTQTPFSAILYDMSAEQGKYIDEFTVLREIAGHSGRAMGLIVIAGLSFFVPLGWTFVIAVIASLALNMVYRVL